MPASSGAAGAGSGGGPALGGTGATSLGGAPPVQGSGGVGLYSDVFESFAGATGVGGGAAVVCPDSGGVCDWTRVTGCCSALACDHASGADVWNPRPIEACQTLVSCVQANPGCSTAEDPLCFGAEAGPCVEEGYNASFEDPAGPFAWTEELARCVCSY